jgi:hypothetical protein
MRAHAPGNVPPRAAIPAIAAYSRRRWRGQPCRIQLSDGSDPLGADSAGG